MPDAGRRSDREGYPRAHGRVRPLAAALVLILLGALPARACPELAVLPDAPDPYELQFGATNVNAALGSGRLTATVSRCGELTSVKWPGPSYYNQLSYLTPNAPDARAHPHLGALDTMGAFAGIAWETRTGHGLTWLRDDDWTRTQHYASETSDVIVTEAANETLGLRVTASAFILPDRDVLVLHHQVERLAGSPVRRATLVLYTNFDPTLARLPTLPIADWALPFANDFAVAYDHRERAFLHFVPESAKAFPHDFSVVNPILRQPPASRRRLQRAVDRMVAGLTGPGVYVAVGAAPRDHGFQAGFDDAPTCAHQSPLVDRVLDYFMVGPPLSDIARSQYQCDHVITDPDGPLGACRRTNGWTYTAPSAYDDARDGRLSGSPIAACQANAALARPLRFVGRRARATFYVTVAGTREAANALLREARRGKPESQQSATDSWWASYLAPARLPATDDARVLAFARRSLIAMRTATDDASGAIVASVAVQNPYGADWPRDGSFINYALDLAGYTETVSRHNRFYARVQRKVPGAWSILYSRTCPPDCVPAGTYETNYYADPDAVVPANLISFEIDEAGLGVWTMWDHYQHITDPAAATAYLTDICPAIRLGAVNLAACRDLTTHLQCPANEDDNIPFTQGLQGAETVLLALRSAVAAASACAFDAGEAAGWQTRADELAAAITANFLDSTPPAHFVGGRPGWLIWPVGFLTPNDPLALSHAQYLRQQSLDPILERTAPAGAYDAEALLVRAQLFRMRGDMAALAETQDQVRFFVRELTTADTLHMAEVYGRVQLDLNGDGVLPDYLPQNDVPHVWEHAYLYAAAMVAFGTR